MSRMCRCIFWGRSTTLGDATAASFRLAPVPRMRSGINGIKESNHEFSTWRYHVTLVKDATAAFDREGLHAAHVVNGTRFAHAILNTEELLALLPEPRTNDNSGETHE